MQKHIKMNTLAEFVKNRRKQLNLTQEEFAEKAGVALTVIRKIEQELLIV
jgi:transcriptional regulator with XRE-family HTH domain